MFPKIEKFMSFFGTLITEVGEWSRFNFGPQRSKWFGDVILGGAAPLLGVGEEIGEMAESFGKDNAQFRDGIGDQMIYLADVLYRHELQPSILDYNLLPILIAERSALVLKDSPRRESDLSQSERVSAEMGVAGIRIVELAPIWGRVLHAFLKRHQGIRKYSDLSVFYADVTPALTNYIARLAILAKFSHGEGSASDVSCLERLQDLTQDVWSEVKQRNWNKYPSTGS